MATPPSDDTKMLFRLLRDREWHSYNEIKAAVAEKVPPGRALRKYQQRLRESREMRGLPGVETARSEDEQIRLGAMACAQVALTSWKGKGIMFRGEGAQKEIKIKPGFQTWGIATNSPAETPEEAESAEGSPEVPQDDSEPPEAPYQTTESPPERIVAVPVAEEVAPAVEEVAPPVAEPAVAEAFVPAPAVEEPVPVESEPALDVVTAAGAESQPVSYWTGPSCPECFMAITNEAAHAQWHVDLKAAYESPSVLNLGPEEIQTLLGDVVRQALARFQVGMQDWMDERFAQLEAQIRLAQKVRDPRIPWAEKQ